MKAFFTRAQSELAAGRRVYICFVAANRKGSPGTPAARMLLTESGEQYGTIGGGIMERRVLDDASRILASGEHLSPTLQTLTHRGAAEDASGLICGGGQSNVFLILEPTEVHRGLLERVLEVCDTAPGAYLQINGDGLAVLLSDDSPRKSRLKFEQGSPGWSFDLPLFNYRRIAIFGGGHCGRALADQMLRLSYAVTLIEPRENLFTLDGLSEAVVRLKHDFMKAASFVNCPEWTHAVVMTKALPTDVEALSGILKYTFKSVGVMGSRPKISTIRKQLSDLGYPPVEIDSVRAPVGLSFDSDTPEEIAVSIAAQILLERNES